MANKRVFYPCEQVGIAPDGTKTFTALKGVQVVDLNTSFNLEQVFELGQLEIYENIETLPNVEVTVEKVLDGTPLAYFLATSGATENTLLSRSDVKSIVGMSFFSDTSVRSSGTPLHEVVMSGMFVNSLSYSFPVDGNFTENLSLVGNDMAWATDSFTFNGQFTADENAAVDASGVQRREDLDMANSIWPTEIIGIEGNGRNVEASGSYLVHIQDIEISVDLGREDINEQGRKRPYHRYATFPVEVTCSISTLAAGDLPGHGIDADSESDNNLTDQKIKIVLNDGTAFDLGNRNKLSSVTFGGGDAGGGNATITYNYSNWNTLTITGNDVGF